MANVYRGRRLRPHPLNIKPIGLPSRRIPRKHGMRNYTIECDGGPLDGERLKVRHPCGTLVIEMRGEAGYYSPGGKWMSA